MYPDEMVAKAFGLSSFTAVGHLLHINLRDNLLQHKHDIGQALLNKNTRALAVVNKVNSIDNTYRNFDIEIIAKRSDCALTDEELMVCEVNENKCRFKLDFSKVYWNSRLCTEHERIITKLKKSHDFVFDAFAGVGPFSVPAAKIAKCNVFANDLNPDAVKWLKVNMERNKVNPSMYEIFNKDAKDFIQHDIKLNLLDIYKHVDDENPATSPTIHILMNLPALAPTFLQYFIGLLNIENENPPKIDGKSILHMFKQQSLEHIVYCYCFLKGVFDEPKVEVKKMIEENFGRELSDNQLIDIFKVRNVAPFKDMYRVEIRLDEKILFDTKDPVSIMKKSCSQTPTTNGHTKKVTMNVVAQKRSHDETFESVSLASDEGVDSKRAKVGDYCSIM